jgi:hypothetical protein
MRASLTSWVLRHFVVGTAVLAVAAYVVIYARILGEAPIRSDGYSYYVYLPSWFLYRDLSLDALARDWYGGSYPAFMAILRWPSTGRWLNAHPIGTALLMAPFFAVGHLLTRWSNLPPDGFSFYYEHAAGLAGLTYFVSGLALMRGILRRHFTSGVTLATLVAMTWGTNLFHYGVFDSTFSHAYSFFLITLFLDLTDRWWTQTTFELTCGLGVTAALVVLTRHTNILFLLLLPLSGITLWRDAGPHAAALWRRRRSLAAICGIVLAGVLPQLIIYRRATGSWLVSSYSAVGSGFIFDSPHVLDVLFSTQKGLFFWSPLLLLAVAGLVVGRGWAQRFVVPVAVIFTIDTYLIASWSDWQFGASYGHRGFTDGLGVLAIFLAAFFAWTAERPRLARFVTAGVALAVLMSTAQMLQYWLGILPMANTTWEQYRAIFLRLS